MGNLFTSCCAEKEDEINEETRMIAARLWDTIVKNKVTTETVELILGHEGNSYVLNYIHDADSSVRPILHYCQSSDVTAALLKAGANVNSKDIYHCTALHHASNNNQLEILQTLLNGQADVNAQDKEGKTALHYAVGARAVPIIKELLKRGCDPNLETANEGNTALHIACTEASFSCVQALVLGSTAGVDSTTTTTTEESNGSDNPISSTDEERLKIDVNASNHAGKTPLDCYRGAYFYDEIATFLKPFGAVRSG